MKKIIQQLLGSAASKKSNKLAAWVSDLAELDDLAALQSSTKHLGLIVNQTEGDDVLSTQQQLDLIIELEALNQARLEKLSIQFSHMGNMKPELEASICETCYSYCRQSYIVHLKIIEKIFDKNKTKPENNIQPEANLPAIIIARALNSAFNMIKWRLFSKTNPPAKVWLQINLLYRIATQKMLLNETVELFNLEPSTTIAAHFVQTYMLGQLAQTGLQKYQVEIATRILNTLLTRSHISNIYTPEQYLFYIDLEKDNAAKRMRDFEPNNSCRYWELDELEKQLSIAITVSDRGEIPQSLAFSKIDNAKKLNETLLILLDEWKKTGHVRQRRKIRREPAPTRRLSLGTLQAASR